MTELEQIDETEYRDYLKSVSKTKRGRAFLREHEKRTRTMGIDEVYRLVEDLRKSWHQQTEIAQTVGHIDVLRRELQDMSASIVNARREISALRPKDGGKDRINSATNELDAIVLATERASFEILNAAERILDIAGRLRAASAPAALCDDLETEATSLFTACSFQDLTGQRTTKVVNALRYIEQRVLAMMGIWGTDGTGIAAPIAEPVDQRPDAHLLNGPTEGGVDQGEIDRLLNGAPPPPSPTPEPLDQGDIDSLFP